MIFTPEQRDLTLARVLALGKADGRLTAGVLTGSMGRGTADRWSDIDVAFVVMNAESTELVAANWTEQLYRHFPVAHHYEIVFGTTLVRGFLLDNCLAVDLSFTPSVDFEVWGPVRVLFDRTGSATMAANSAERWTPVPAWADHAGFAWHDVLHACLAANRHRPWQALYYLGRVRNRTLSLASERHGYPADEFKHVDDLPPSDRDPLLATLVDRLELPVLIMAIDVATEAFLAELGRSDRTLAARLKQPLMEFVQASRRASQPVETES